MCQPGMREIMSRMRVKASIAAVLGGILSAAIWYHFFFPPMDMLAITIRRKMPDAWFSGLIAWYALFFAIAISLGVGTIAAVLIYKALLNRHTPQNGHAGLWVLLIIFSLCGLYSLNEFLFFAWRIAADPAKKALYLPHYYFQACAGAVFAYSWTVTLVLIWRHRRTA